MSQNPDKSRNFFAAVAVAAPSRAGLPAELGAILASAGVQDAQAGILADGAPWQACEYVFAVREGELESVLGGLKALSGVDFALLPAEGRRKRLLHLRDEIVELAPAQPAADLVLAPEDDGVAIVGAPQQVLRVVQPRVGEEGRAGHPVAVDQDPLALVADHAAEIPDRRPEALQVGDRPAVEIVVPLEAPADALTGEGHESRHGGVRDPILRRCPQRLVCRHVRWSSFGVQVGCRHRRKLGYHPPPEPHKVGPRPHFGKSRRKRRPPAFLSSETTVIDDARDHARPIARSDHRFSGGR